MSKIKKYGYPRLSEIIKTPLDKREDYTEIVVVDAETRAQILSFYVNKNYEGIYFKLPNGTFECSVPPSMFHLGLTTESARMSVLRVVKIASANGWL